MVKATTVTWWVPWILCSLNIMAWRKHLCLNRKILQLSTCVSDRKDVVWLIGHQLFQRKPEERAVFSLCNHTAVKIERDAVWNQTAMRPAAVAKEFVPVSCEHDQRHVNLKLDLISYNSVKRWKKKNPEKFCFHLDNRMSSRCSFDGSSAALRLVVGSVVWPRLDLNTQLILVKLGWQRPIKWRQGVRPEINQMWEF